MQEKEGQEAFQQAAEGFLQSIPQLQTQQEMGEGEALQRKVLQEVFRPMVYYLVEHGHRFSEDTHSPEGVINEVLKRQELELGDPLKAALKDNFPINGTPRNWEKEAVAISVQGIEHPVSKLCQVVTSNLSVESAQLLARQAI